jgi:hypothetical protein
MRDIRSRIAQRHGVELTSQQIHDLATRRLESILDVRSVRPELLDLLRRAAGSSATQPAAPPPASPYSFDESTIYGGDRGLLGVVRKLLRPLLRLFIDPDPVVHALKAQADLNADLLARDAARTARQEEWNALHYEILQRLVTEMSRSSLETQGLALKVESLSAKVDFNERRVRSIEGAAHQPRQAGRVEAPASPVSPSVGERPGPDVAPDLQVGDAPRRRRRRRRGRRQGGLEPAPGTLQAAAEPDTDVDSMDTGQREIGAEGDIGSAESAMTSAPEAASDAPFATEPAPPRDETPAADASEPHDTNQTDR